jgi:hypothetical protein
MTKKLVIKKRKVSNLKEIPPPPGPEASWEDQAAYFEKYDWDDLRLAGYLHPLTKKEKTEHDRFSEALRQQIKSHRRKVS